MSEDQQLEADIRVIAESVPKRTLRLNLWHLFESREKGFGAEPL
jgi:hypothetical protein